MVRKVGVPFCEDCTALQLRKSRRQVLFERQLPQPDVVILAAGEVGQQRSPPLRRQHPQIDLLPAVQFHRGLG